MPAVSAAASIGLKAGQTLLLNGERFVLPVNVTVAFHERVSFMHGKQIMQEADATTPLRNIYFALQEAYPGEGYGCPASKTEDLGPMQDTPWFNDVDLGSEIRLAAHLMRMGDFRPALLIVRNMIVAAEAEIPTDKVEAAA